MPRKIIVKQSSQKKDESTTVPENKTILHGEQFLEILKKRFPDRLQYSIKETSEITGLSYDFIREKIQQGSISAARFGDRYMINQLELARMLSEGVS